MKSRSLSEVEYLIIFDDQTFKQIDDYADAVPAIADGYCDVLRFEGGTFQRLIVGSDGLTAWQAVEK